MTFVLKVLYDDNFQSQMHIYAAIKEWKKYILKSLSLPFPETCLVAKIGLEYIFSVFSWIFMVFLCFLRPEIYL